MNKNILKNIEWSVVICIVLLITIGLFALFSATQNAGYDEFKKQIIWVAISIPVCIALLFINYETLAKISPIMYIITIGLLIGVIFTRPINGASSWFQFGGYTFQPSELAKIVIILVLAYVMSIMKEKGKDEISRPTRLLMLVGILALPVGLILKQPDIGTAVAFLVAFGIMLFIGGIKKRYIISTIIIIVVAIPLMYQFLLPDHAKSRIDVFLNPELDPRGAGYNVMQSKLAIGAGELVGMGLLKGNQTQLGFLHPKSTDFIFSVIGEEMGFVVAGAVIILYVVLITKAMFISKTAKDNLGSFIAAGITAILLFHMVENVGMTMGLLPITGVPLPFVSYGGSSMLTNLIMIALLLNISGRRKKAIFTQ